MSVKRPARLVFDTNVLLDLWLFADPRTHALRASVEARRVQPLRSAACDAEFAEVLARDQFGLSEAARTDLLTRWRDLSHLIPTPAPAPLACADGDDQKFLDAAFGAGADFLLTRDKALLRLARRAAAAGVTICTPEAAVLRAALTAG